MDFSFVLRQKGYNDEMKIVQVDDENLDFVVGEAVRALKKGKVLVCPTDTVYGLVADATNEEAVQRVFKIKGREKGKPLPVFVKDRKMAKQFAHINISQTKFLKNNWPGKVTAVLESTHVLPKELELHGKIALRIPDYELLNLLLKKVTRPLTGTSANVSGAPSCSSAQEVIAQFKREKYKPDLLIDAGRLPKSKPSKVIDITGNRRKIIRN